MKFKVMQVNVVPEKSEKGEPAFVPIPRHGGKTVGVSFCYTKEYVKIGENLSFSEAKAVRNENYGSWIVEE